MAVRPAAAARFSEATHVLVSRSRTSRFRCSSCRANAWLFCGGDGLLSHCSTVETGSRTFKVESRGPADSEGRGAVMGGAYHRAITGGSVIWWRCWREGIAVQGRFGLLTGTAGYAFVDEVCSCPGDAFTVFEGAFVDDHRSPLVVCALRSIRRSDQSGLA